MADVPVHRLFFAVRPPPGILVEIAEARDAAGLVGKPVRDDRLHITLFLFDDAPALVPDIVARARAAMAGLGAAPFRVVFDRIVRGGGPAVLVPSEPVAGIEGFQSRLAAALRAQGQHPRADWRFNPHVTLLHGGRGPVDTIIPPISWQVDEIVLLDSLVGLTEHRLVARWVLI